MEYLYETHMHTSEVSACAVSAAVEQVSAYKQLGYTGIIITDHFINGNSACPYLAPWDEKMRFFMSGYENAKKAGEKCGLDVFFGWEYTIKGSDFLTYGLDLDFMLAHPDFDILPIEQYSTLVRESGGYIAQAHPYRDAWYIEHKYPVDPKFLDGVEVLNAGDPEESNSKARAFAEQHGLPMQAGSDSHNALQGYRSGIVLKRKAADIFDIIRAIKANEADIILSN